MMSLRIKKCSSWMKVQLFRIQKQIFLLIQSKKTSAKLTTIKSIHERSSIDEYVNVVAHAVLDSNGVQDVTTKFGMKKKQEVLPYDDSGSIKLALWNNHIDYLKEDGNYRFKDLRIKSFCLLYTSPSPRDS